MTPKSKIASFFSALFINLRHLNFTKKVEGIVSKMNLSEKIFFYLAGGVAVISGLVLLYQVNNYFTVEVPSFGGSFTEGVVGSPRFINPILAISDTDKSLVALVYSGLLKPTDDGFEPDLAESFSVSEDGTVYDFKIKESAYFHDGKKVTTDDVIFTIDKALDSVIKSPKEVNWSGVSIEKVNDKELKFTLKKPYAPFLNALTMGILPKHIWENATSEEFPFSEFNINPIGSGPYKIEEVSRNSGGILTSITLNAWNKYASEKPKIKKIVFKFFQNEISLFKAYNQNDVDSASGLSQASAKSINSKNMVDTSSLPRVFGVFFNQNTAPVLLNQEIREALNMAVPKQKIVNEVLLGLGKVLNGPTPSNIEYDVNAIAGNIEEAKTLLAKNGWKENADGILEKKTKTGTTLFEFSISTSDAPELKQTAEILQEVWKQIGASVSIKVFEAGDLSQNVIKPRKYDALLFGEVIGEESDLYSFWHSSQRNDPGLNISLYANITTDKMLEEIQKETDKDAVLAKKEIIFSEIKKDVPAVFLFSPNLLYISAPKIKNVSIKKVSYQSERFAFINKWFIETDKVWKIFQNNKNG